MHRTAYVLLMLTTLFWGGNSVAGKLAVGHISPMVLTTARWAFALVIIAALGWRNVRRDWPLIRRHAPMLLLLGTLGFTLFNVALYNALVYTTAINTAVEQAGIPMLIFLFSFLLFRTRVTWALMPICAGTMRPSTSLPSNFSGSVSIFCSSPPFAMFGIMLSMMSSDATPG